MTERLQDEAVQQGVAKRQASVKVSKPPKLHLNGVLLLNKPRGISSTQALGRAKWLLNAQKGGHTGTLDPLADGLLPLCFGHATKLAHDLLDSDKTYRAKVILGQTTSTGDVEGNVVYSNPTVIDREQWDAVVKKFTGPIKQVPPMYSALKKDGKPLYEYARSGIEIEREARDVTIVSLKTISFDYPVVVMDVTCSKGTYIRSLAQDMGEALGVGAHLGALRRTGVADLKLADAMTLEELEAISADDRASVLLPLDALLQKAPALNLSHELAARFVCGQRLPVSQLGQSIEPNITARVYTQLAGQPQRLLLGLAQVQQGVLMPETVLMTRLPD